MMRCDSWKLETVPVNIISPVGTASSPEYKIDKAHRQNHGVDRSRVHLECDIFNVLVLPRAFPVHIVHEVDIVLVWLCHRSPVDLVYCIYYCS